MNTHLYQIIIDVFYDEALQSYLLQDYLEAKTKPKSILKYAKSFDASTRNHSLRVIRIHVRTLLILYKECYADLVAVMALNLSAEEYLLNVFYREAQYIKEISSDETEARLWEIQIQAALVPDTLDKDFAADPKALSYKKEQQEWLDEWKMEISRYRAAFSINRDIPYRSQTDTAMHFGEYFNLLCYLKLCREKLENGLQKEDVRKKQAELIKMMNMVKNYFDFGAIQQAITDYQDTFLETSGSQEK